LFFPFERAQIVEWRDIAIGLMGVGGTVLGWLLREVWGAVGQLRTDMQLLQSSIADKYARKDDVQVMAENIMTFLRRIEDKLDGKADK
jgi:hypothetical protein